MTDAQLEIIERFELGEFGRVEFFEIALEAGLSLEEIEKAPADAEEDI